MSATVRRATRADEAAAGAIVDEYNRAVGVVERDDAAALRGYLDGPGALWLAVDADDVPVGCVVLRPLPDVAAGAGEVKRLYVRADQRGAGLAGALMDALEAYARAAGYDALLLDTKDDLTAAIRFYERRGYARIARYNANPQATLFMRLAL